MRLLIIVTLSLLLPVATASYSCGEYYYQGEPIIGYCYEDELIDDHDGEQAIAELLTLRNPCGITFTTLPYECRPGDIRIGILKDVYLGEYTISTDDYIGYITIP